MKYTILFPFASCLALLSLSCTKNKVDPVALVDTTTMIKRDSFFVVSYDVNALPIVDVYDSGKSVATVNDLALDEISGIAASYNVPGALWAEEDSGNENKIYLLNGAGNTLASLRLPVDDRDWEDLSVAPGPIEGLHYLYLAETGDNNKINSVKFIYRFTEPAVTGPFPIGGTVNDIDKIEFQYPDGIKNAEAVMIDPLTKDIYIISKEDQATVYVARYPQPVNAKFTLNKLGRLPIPTVTAADISPDGKEVIIKNYDRIFYWKKTGTESITALLQQKPVRLIYVPEPKGESVCWSTDGSGFYTTSEIVGNDPTAIYFHKVRK